MKEQDLKLNNETNEVAETKEDASAQLDSNKTDAIPTTATDSAVTSKKVVVKVGIATGRGTCVEVK